MTAVQGWSCPKCGAVYAPWQYNCPTCSIPKTFTSSSSWGTITMNGTAFSSPSYSFEGRLGTAFIGPTRTTLPSPPQRDWKEERAEDIIKQWKGGKWSTLQELIVEALEDATDD